MARRRRQALRQGHGRQDRDSLGHRSEPHFLSGQVDIPVALLGITPERVEKVDFSAPYAGISISLFGLNRLKVTDAVAGKTIARNVEQAATGTSHVSANIVEVSQHANETGAASAQMLGSAQSLSREGSHLKQQMEQFLHAIRTGIANRRKLDDAGYQGPGRRRSASGRSPRRASG